MSADRTELARILVVDDEAAARSALSELLREEGYSVRSAPDGFKALGQLDPPPDLIITDVKMPGMDGIELMQKARDELEAVGVIIMTAFGSVEHAVGALHAGADDYLTKPVHFPEMLLVVKRVLAHNELRRENARLREALSPELLGTGPQWAGESRPAKELASLVREVADSESSVLILGEVGTGKELVARSLHAWGARRDGPFVGLHCEGATEDVLEAELFGDGGRLASARGGVLFLDEVASLPASLQVRLLRYLQDTREDKNRARLVSATDTDLEAAVKAGDFRDDLFYEINVITLTVPTLRQRPDDIPVLAMHFLNRFARHTHKPIVGFSERALRVLTSFAWPGNVRQLQNAVERAVALCHGSHIEPKHLPREIMGEAQTSDGAPSIPGSTMAEIEKYAILQTMEHVRGSTSKAAEMLGISPRKIQYRLAEYRDAEPSGVPSVTKDPE